MGAQAEAAWLRHTSAPVAPQRPAMPKMLRAGFSLSLKYTHVSFGYQLSENCGDNPCGPMLDEGGPGKLVVAKSNRKKKEVNLWRNGSQSASVFVRISGR